MLDKVSLITISKWVLKLSFFDLCQLAVFVPCLSLYLCWAFELLRHPVVGGIRASDSWGRSWSFSLGVYCVTQSLTGWSSDGPERRWTSFSVCRYRCAIAFNGLERRQTSLCVTGMIWFPWSMSLYMLCRSSLWGQDSGRSVSELSLSHSRSMLLWSRSLVRYFFCAVFSSGQADLLEILSEKCSLIKYWMVIIRLVLMLVFMIRVLDTTSGVDSVSL